MDWFDWSGFLRAIPYYLVFLGLGAAGFGIGRHDDEN